MKLTILGTSAAYAGKEQNCPSYLLSAGERHYLIDTGPGCVSFLQKFIPIQDISGVLLSHLHADHTSDFHTLRYGVYIAQERGLMKREVPLYLPGKPRNIFKNIRKTAKENFHLTLISESLSLSLNGLKVRFKKTAHAITAYAMSFEEKQGQSAEKSLVYTADTAYFDELVQFCKGANILLAEATFQNSERELANLGHMTAESAAALARNAGVHTLILTHIMPYYDPGLSLEEAKRTFDGEVIIAHKGQQYTL